MYPCLNWQIRNPKKQASNIFDFLVDQLIAKVFILSYYEQFF